MRTAARLAEQTAGLERLVSMTESVGRSYATFASWRAYGLVAS